MHCGSINIAVFAAYKLLNLKASKKASYVMYLEQYEKLDEQLRNRAKDLNDLNERQRAGFVSYVELQMSRKKLPLAAKRGCYSPSMVDAYSLSGIVSRPVCNTFVEV